MIKQQFMERKEGEEAIRFNLCWDFIPLATAYIWVQEMQCIKEFNNETKKAKVEFPKIFQYRSKAAINF